MLISALSFQFGTDALGVVGGPRIPQYQCYSNANRLKDMNSECFCSDQFKLIGNVRLLDKYSMAKAADCTEVSLSVSFLMDLLLP